MALPVYTSSAFTGQNGLEIAAGASVEVRSEADDSLVTLYSDRAGAVQINNPFQADAYGRFAFFASPNSDGWRITVTSGSDAHTLRYQQPMGSLSGVQASAFMVGLLEDEDATAVRGTLELGTAAIEDAGTDPDELPTNTQVAATLAASLRGHIAGLTLSNNSTDAEHDIDIAAGVATADDQTHVIQLSAALTKQIDVTWAVGTNQGGLDTGTVAIDTWYHVWLIRRSDTGVVDVLFSTSASSPTMPTNYDQKRRIGAVLTDGSANILAFVQNGDRFLWKAPPLDVDVSNLGATPTNYPLSTPAGVKTVAALNVQASKAAAQPLVYVYDIDQDDPASLGTGGVIPAVRSTVQGISSPVGNVEVVTDTSSQIRAVASEAGVTLSASTLGYIDMRGKND